MKFLYSTFFLMTLAHATPLIDVAGCPEDSHCSKTTGKRRMQWIEMLRKFQKNSLGEEAANKIIRQTSGFPISIWMKNSTNPQEIEGSITWESPCKQHQIKDNKILMGDIYLSDLKDTTTKKYSQIIFSNVILKVNDELKVVRTSRGDAPLLVTKNTFYYTKNEEGEYFGLNVGFNGELKMTNTISISHFPREIPCPKEMIDLFYRQAPSLNFYQGHICKEIWNQDTHSYSPLIMGWSCN